MYAIVDIETTGGYAQGNRITEIAIFVHNGKEIIDQYQTLINPERYIPHYITGLTGIDAQMVSEAPKFGEVAPKILELLEDKVFVAHNVHFDYSFLKREFTELGIPFHLKKLCTVRLSRRIIPGLRSYGLGSLSKSLGITIEDRHRAGGDAEATARIFSLLVQRDRENHIQQALKQNYGETKLPPHLNREEFDGLPELPGVYYFHDLRGEVIYVGKAVNIKKRITGHFTGFRGDWQKQGIINGIYHISYELTGNELIALLLESYEIKNLWPKFNRAQKNMDNKWGVYGYFDQKGYHRLKLGRLNPTLTPLVIFRSHAEGWKFMMDKTREHDLCPRLTGLHKAKEACFDYDLGSCDGACVGQVSAEHYNLRVNNALSRSDQEDLSYMIIGKGREEEEKSLVLVEQGTYRGFGFLPGDQSISNIEEAKNFVKIYPDNREVQSILQSHLLRERASNIITFENVTQG